MAKLYIVHATDAEGPLYESLSATFKRLKDYFDVQLPATKANLVKLQAGDIDLGGKTKAVQDFVSEGQIGTYLASWDQIDAMHETVMDKAWRAKFPDSDGNPYIISWHCMDHVGYVDNPRRRSMGYHSVFDHYTELLDGYALPDDRLYWHFHQVGFSREAHRFGRNLSFSNTHNDILARRVIDRQWFPSVNRPGGHMEHYDSNMWLEAWVPFDLANQSMESNVGMESLLAAGRLPGSFGDWRGAPTSWQPYHPEHLDYRQPGTAKRWIGRCLNLEARHSNISKAELVLAFERVRAGEDTMVAITDHDFRDMVSGIEYFYGMLKEVAKDYPDVSFEWANSIKAFRRAVGLKKQSGVNLSLTVSEKCLTVSSDGDIWGVQPFLALRTREGNYYHDNLIVNGGREWVYPFDPTTIDLFSLSHVGVACNDLLGNVSAAVSDVVSGEELSARHNEADWA